MTDVYLNGFFAPGFVTDHPVLITLGAPIPGTAAPGETPPIEIVDARPLQAVASSESAFFEQHGFVLLPHPSAMKQWDSDPKAPAEQSEIARIYLPEVDALIRHRLLPGKRLEIQQSPTLVRRGEGTPNPQYGNGIHQDFALSADDYQENLEAFSSPEYAGRWRARYDRDDVDEFMTINFWRTTNMPEPLEHMPLAVCDPNTVDSGDIVRTGLRNFAPTGKPTVQMGLRYNAGQKWFWNPGMLTSEVLAFKIFQCSKRDNDERLRTCFHTAFTDPCASPAAQQRQSCEHRVGVFVLNT